MTGFGGLEAQYPKPARAWLFEGIFDPGVHTYVTKMPDENGIMEITYEDGVTTLVQGVETAPDQVFPQDKH